MPIKHVITSQRVPVKIWTDDVDEKSKQQLANIASLPFVHHHVAAMPDVHLGIGATIGSVIATYKAIIPAAVAVDIGCGMVVCRSPATISGSFPAAWARAATSCAARAMRKVSPHAPMAPAAG